MPWPFNIDSHGNSPEREFIISEARRAWGYESPFPDSEKLLATDEYVNMFKNLRINYTEGEEFTRKFIELYESIWKPIDTYSDYLYTKIPY